jgi:hypothetical protein
MGHKPKSAAFLYYRSFVATLHLQHARLGLAMKDMAFLSGSTLGVKDGRPIHLSLQGWANLVEIPLSLKFKIGLLTRSTS